MIILALSSSGAKGKYFQTSAPGLLINVTLQFHSRGWITIPGVPSKKNWNSNGVMKLYITNSHSFLEIAGANNYTRVAFFLRLAQTFFRFHDPTAGLPNLGRLPLFDKQTALVIVDMQRDCQCVFSSDESGTEILHILGKYEKVCQLLDTAQFFLTTCEHTHTHTPPSSSAIIIISIIFIFFMFIYTYVRIHTYI